MNTNPYEEKCWLFWTMHSNAYYFGGICCQCGLSNFEADENYCIKAK